MAVSCLIKVNSPSGTWQGWLPSRWQLCLFAVISMLILSAGGCAVRPPAADPQQEQSDSLAAKYRHKAIAFEKKGQLREALLSWWIVYSYYPHNEVIAGKITMLKEKTGQCAAVHFGQAVSFYQQGAIKDARREFLRTLTFDPEHRQALGYLMNELHDTVFREYTVRQGDTLQKIAGDIYHDPDKEFLITSFNPHVAGGNIRPGSKLQLVVFDEGVAGMTKYIEKVSYNGSLVLEPRRQKKRIVASVGADMAAEEMERPVQAEEQISDSSVHYQKAKELLDQEEYLDALLILRSIDRRYRDVDKLIAYTEVFLQQEADAHYRKGISYYLSENMAMAIWEWEEVLRLNPNHLKAKKDLRNARRLQRKMKKL